MNPVDGQPSDEQMVRQANPPNPNVFCRYVRPTHSYEKPWFHIVRVDSDKIVSLGIGITEDEAWADARAKLEVKDEPATNSVPCEVCGGTGYYHSDGYPCQYCKEAEPATSNVGLPPLDEEALRADANEGLTWVEASLLCRERQLLSLQSQLQEARAEIETRNKWMHSQFGFVPSPDGSIECACAYCTKDVEALADHAADMEMQLFLPGGWKDRAEAAESQNIELKAEIQRLSQSQDWLRGAKESLNRTHPSAPPKAEEVDGV